MSKIGLKTKIVTSATLVKICFYAELYEVLDYTMNTRHKKPKQKAQENRQTNQPQKLKLRDCTGLDRQQRTANKTPKSGFLLVILTTVKS